MSITIMVTQMSMETLWQFFLNLVYQFWLPTQDKVNYNILSVQLLSLSGSKYTCISVYTKHLSELVQAFISLYGIPKAPINKLTSYVLFIKDIYFCVCTL